MADDCPVTSPVFWKNGSLLTAQAFPSIALISLLTTPMVKFVQGLPMVIRCIGCDNRRIEAACVMQGCIQHWLGFVLDCIVAALAAILVITVVVRKDSFSAGSVVSAW